MLTASPSPRLTPSAHQNDSVAGFLNPGLRRESLSRIGSSKGSSPIIKPHSAHVSGFPLAYPAQSSSSGQTQSQPTQARNHTTSTTVRSQCASSIDQRSHHPSVRSISTQTSPLITDIFRPSHTNTKPSQTLMVDAQTQYSPPLSTQPTSHTTVPGKYSLSPQLASGSVVSTPTSTLAHLRLSTNEPVNQFPTSPTYRTAISQTSKRPYNPSTDAAMPVAPTGLSNSSNASKKEGGKSHEEKTPPHTPQSSVKREHSTTASEPKSPSQSTRQNGVESDGQSTGPGTETLNTPSKKPRPADPVVKIMPLQYETCDTRDLVILISSMLMELIRYNDTIPLTSGSSSDASTSNLTRFHSRAPPGISVIDYLQRLTTHATLSPPILLSMVYYIDRLASYYPAFTISSLTVHRFLITAATVASKGLSDSFWTNKTYARVGGVSVKELALLELEFLVRVQWRIVPRPEVLVDYYKSLVARSVGYAMEDGKND